MSDYRKVIDIAAAEVGYLEKASNSQLDSKTANAGSKNYTKYARDLVSQIGAPYSNGAAWCDMFVDWCFIQAFGLTEAKRLLLGWSAYTPTSAGYFKNAGQWHTDSPQAGDIIFFDNGTRICHTGIVIAVDARNVTTIEGNTSGASGVIANGGGVCQKNYSIYYSRIAGYGRPAYTATGAANSASGTSNTTTAQKSDMTTIKGIQAWAGTTADGIYGTKTKKAIVKKAQAAIGVTADGIFGPKSRAAWKNLKSGSTGNAVKAMQAMLICRGYSCGSCGADGDFGSGTLAAVKAFQRAKGLTVDGIAGKNTASELFG